jgi:hypothetical protein
MFYTEPLLYIAKLRAEALISIVQKLVYQIGRQN